MLDATRWQQALNLAAEWAVARKAPAITLVTGTRDRIEGPASFGSLTIGGAVALPAKPIYLIASITKPIVALAALRLIEQGRLTLSDRVTDYIPEFGKHGKYPVEVRHLLTHTSGLPDMLPQNSVLRAGHAPLADFVAGTCEIVPSFPPGRGVQYQSMGFAVLAAILEKIDGRSCARLLQDELFGPLDMVDTALGAPDDWFEPGGRIERVPEIHVSAEQARLDWNWNSRYWRQLGAPWGGLFTTADDLARFAQMLLRRGRIETGRLLLAPATIVAATMNQLQCMKDVPEDERRCRPWGLGWRLNWPAHSANFGDLLGPRTYGHWGATGTVMWIDPEAGTFCIILSTEPQEPTGFFLARLSNAVAAAWG